MKRLRRKLLILILILVLSFALKSLNDLERQTGPREIKLEDGIGKNFSADL